MRGTQLARGLATCSATSGLLSNAFNSLSVSLPPSLCACPLCSATMRYPLHGAGSSGTSRLLQRMELPSSGRGCFSLPRTLRGRIRAWLGRASSLATRWIGMSSTSVVRWMNMLHHRRVLSTSFRSASSPPPPHCALSSPFQRLSSLLLHASRTWYVLFAFSSFLLDFRLYPPWVLTTA